MVFPSVRNTSYSRDLPVLIRGKVKFKDSSKNDGESLTFHSGGLWLNFIKQYRAKDLASYTLIFLLSTVVLFSCVVT